LLTYIFWCILPLLGIGGLGGNKNITADEIAGIGLGVAALIGAVGYLVMRRRSGKHE